MVAKQSAGLLVYRKGRTEPEVLLAHPGGPFFARKDNGHWTIPKGEIEPGEAHLAAAIREFKEEIGLDIPPDSNFLPLGSIRQKGGKTVYAWAVERSCADPLVCNSGLFEMEWPIGSGKRQKFPEVDRAQFFPLLTAKQKLKDTQLPFLQRLQSILPPRDWPTYGASRMR
jgi:predicted NUDIX family NTP pyrophosphohydrolase